MYVFEGYEFEEGPGQALNPQTQLDYLQTLEALQTHLGANEDNAARPDPDASLFVYAAHGPALPEFGARDDDASLLFLWEVAKGLGKRHANTRYAFGITHLGQRHNTVTALPDLSGYRTNYRPMDLLRFNPERAAQLRRILPYVAANGLFDGLEAQIWVSEQYPSALIQGANEAGERGERRMRKARLDAVLRSLLEPEGGAA